MIYQTKLSSYPPRKKGESPLYVFVGQKYVPGAIVINSLIRVTNTSEGSDCRYP